MLRFFYTLPLMAIYATISCSQISNSPERERKSEYKIRKFEYASLTIPQFFSALIKNHQVDFYQIDSLSYIDFCEKYDLLIKDSLNIKKIFTIKILHDLFTSKTAVNCSRGEILDIPYMWHWVAPNPRHKVYFTANKQLLNQTKPPQEFSKYKSYADIDRTPYLFLSDLVQENPKYYSSCDTFSTFGWCSEREMAFVALTKLLNIDGKVVAKNNHSWSEFVVKMKTSNNEFQNFKVTIDNTFNNISWEKIANDDIANWKTNFGNSKLAAWYNNTAKSQTELQKIKNHVISKKGTAKIEEQVVKYLNAKINNY